MVRLFFNVGLSLTMETCPIAKQFAKVDLKICQILVYAPKIAQSLAEFCQSSEISPNMVTLDG